MIEIDDNRRARSARVLVLRGGGAEDAAVQRVLRRAVLLRGVREVALAAGAQGGVRVEEAG